MLRQSHRTWGSARLLNETNGDDDDRDQFPDAEESLLRLHRSGWSVNCTRFHGGKGPVWIVSGYNGENQVLSAAATRDEAWWIENVRFFDVQRERIWIFWRRVLHTAHHRTQLTLYLRLLDQPVPSTYGPTADETWEGADPTT